MTWVRSFISHFKKAMLFVAVVIVVTEVMNYLYVDDTDDFDRYTMYAFYEEKQNIDRLYLGSSHVFCDINPVLLDDINGENNFNLATGAQRLNTAYYLLKEVEKKHKVSRVYLDLYYDCTIGELGDPKGDLPYSWFVVNQMRPSLNKLAYMLDLSSPRYYYLTFLPFIRYKDQLFNLNYVANVVRGKQSESWKNHEYLHISRIDGKEYVFKNGEKGFRLGYIAPEEGGFYRTDQEKPLMENPMAAEQMEYLIKIIEHCKENEIILTWIGCPISDFQLARNGAYDHYVRQISELADQYRIPYYDFNLCRSEYLALSQDRHWADMGHLNTEGAEIFTQFMGQFLTAQEEGLDTYQDCFHGSYEEKMQAMPKTIYGLEAVRSEDYERCLADIPKEQWGAYIIYKIHPVANCSLNEIVVEVYTEGEEIQLVRDENNVYAVLSTAEHGTMRVEAKLKDDEEVTNWVQIEY